MVLRQISLSSAAATSMADLGCSFHSFRIPNEREERAAPSTDLGRRGRERARQHTKTCPTTHDADAAATELVLPTPRPRQSQIPREWKHLMLKLRLGLLEPKTQMLMLHTTIYVIPYIPAIILISNGIDGRVRSMAHEPRVR